MLIVKFCILPGVLIGMVLGLLGLFWHGRELRRRPVMFAQATVVALGEGVASFELFDGQILRLTLSGGESLRVGDYGRLTYRAGRFLSLDSSPSKPL